MSKAFAEELDYGRSQLWLGVMLLGGAAIYFALPLNPHVMILYFALLAAVVFTISLRRHLLPFAAALCCCVLLAGAIAADLETRLFSSAMIAKETAAVSLQGHVVNIEHPVDYRPRIVLRVENIEKFEEASSPDLVRLTGVNLRELQIGDHVKLNARLRPLPVPTHPGGYNPAFNLFFDGLGGVGTVAEKPEQLAAAEYGIFENFRLELAKWRNKVTMHIRTNLEGETGAVAASLVTGDREGLGEDLYRSFNASGLMHVLSISGLHMILVAG
ncbi:MAG: ComEC/Rec2 family competence protein, partial [Pseudomonadota bacterium]